jgi:toxin FitB
VILLDTNVVSELMRPRPDPDVVAWVDAQDLRSLWICTPTIMEIEYGLELLDDSVRRLRLKRSFAALTEQDLEGRIHSFDQESAMRTAALLALKRRQGRTMELRDAMIAGIAQRHRARLATRNIRHFDDCGIELIDPWSP